MGFGVWGLGFGVGGLGFGVWGLGFGVWGLGFGVWGLGFGVWGCLLLHDAQFAARKAKACQSTICYRHTTAPPVLRRNFNTSRAQFSAYSDFDDVAGLGLRVREEEDLDAPASSIG